MRQPAGRGRLAFLASRLVALLALLGWSEASPVVGRYGGSSYLSRHRESRGGNVSTQLENLTVSLGVLSPAFAPTTLAYNVTVPNGTTYV